MPKLTENVLIGGRVRLAGEDISEADAAGVRPEVFALEVEPVAADDVDLTEGEGSEGDSAEESDPVEDEAEPDKAPRRRSPAKK